MIAHLPGLYSGFQLKLFFIFMGLGSGFGLCWNIHGILP